MVRIAESLRLRLIPALGVALALALSGCAAGQIAQTAQQVAAIDGANGDAGSVGVRNVLLATPPTQGYPAGSDVPVTLWLVNSSPVAADTLVSVATPVADSVQISGTAEVRPRSRTQITDQSDTTVTVTGLKQDLPYGHSIPLTFTFAQAGQIVLNVAIAVPEGRDDSSREVVNIQPAHPEDLWMGGPAESAPAHSETGSGPVQSTG